MENRFIGTFSASFLITNTKYIPKHCAYFQITYFLKNKDAAFSRSRYYQMFQKFQSDCFKSDFQKDMFTACIQMISHISYCDDCFNSDFCDLKKAFADI